MAVSIKEIARRAGVSPSSVSRALNDQPGIGAKTVQRIKRIARELGYTVDARAQALVTGKVPFMGLVVRDITNPFYPALARGAQEALAQQGNSLLLFDTGWDENRLQRALSLLTSRRVGGLLLASPLELLLDQLQLKPEELQAPVVLVGGHGLRTLPFTTVYVNDQLGGWLVGSHLAQLGWHRIAYLSGPRREWACQERLRGLERALREQGRQPVHAVTHGDWTVESGYDQARQLLRQRVPPDALFVANDQMAIGAARAAADVGLALGSELALVGYDDIDHAQYLEVPLTTVAQPKEELGRKAAELLMAAVAGDTLSVPEPLAPTLVVRASCGATKKESTSTPGPHLSSSPDLKEKSTMSAMSPLKRTVTTTDTDYWNDSCSVSELTYAIEHGATGATTNPTIVLQVLEKEMHLWEGRLAQIIEQNPRWTERDVAWQLIADMAVRGAELLQPVFEQENHRKGRLSIQTDPANYRNAAALADQAEAFHQLAPNMQVKIPVTSAGVEAIEEATARGVSVNATVCFTVPQALAVGEAIERGLTRREEAGQDISDMSPVCTIMVGRMDDWLKVVAKRDSIVVDPGTLDWAGVACMKRAYGLYRERNYRTRLLAAAYRNHLHWSELIGGDLVLTIPYEWQVLFNASDIEVTPRMDQEVDQKVLTTLQEKFVDFRQAYEPDGLAISDFDNYGATRRTLRGFLQNVYDLVAVVRDVMVPNPD
jgi:transaldolase